MSHYIIYDQQFAFSLNYLLLVHRGAMQNQKLAELQKPYNCSARKHQLQQQFQNLPQQNARSRISLHNAAENSQTADHHRDIAKLNNDLRYSGFNTLESFAFCNSQQAEQIHRVVYQLLSSRERERDKAKEFQKKLHSLQYENKRLESRLQLMTDQASHFQTQRERFNEKVKTIERDFKEKEDKYIKERLNFQKEKKASESREGVIKNQFKKKEDKIAQLQCKLRKMLQKNEKSDFKNSFQVLENLQKKTNQSNYFSAQNNIANNFHQRIYYESLDSENKLLREYLREVIGKLFKIVYTNREDTQKEYQLKRCLSLLEMPFEHSQKFRQILVKLLNKTEQLIYAPKNDSFRNQDNSDNESLLSMIQKMKYCYSNWQKVQQRRSNVIKDAFNLFSKKQKLNQPTLQKITKCLNQPENISNYGFQSKMKELQEFKNIFDYQKNKLNRSLQFFRQKLQFLQKQSIMIHLLQENMENLLEPNENSNSLT